MAVAVAVVVVAVVAFLFPYRAPRAKGPKRWLRALIRRLLRKQIVVIGATGKHMP